MECTRLTLRCQLLASCSRLYPDRVVDLAGKCTRCFQSGYVQDAFPKILINLSNNCHTSVNDALHAILIFFHRCSLDEMIYVILRSHRSSLLGRTRRSSVIRASSRLPERNGTPRPKGIVVGGGWAGLGAAHAMTAAGMEVSRG